jgi:Ca2+-binding RTX toxin-like protein
MYQSSYRRFLSLVFAILASVLVISNAILPRVVTAVQADPVISSGAGIPSDSALDLLPAFTFSAAAQPVVNNAVPGRTAVFTHTLTNDGNGTDTFTIIITPPGGWTADPIEPISLDSNESRQVVVRVGVPAGQGGGSYQFDVTAQSTSTPTLVAQTRQDTVVVVGAAVPRLSPPQTKGATLPLPTTVVFTHILTNTGNQAGTFSLAASVVGAPSGWSAIPSQPSCSLVQNASCTFTVHVTVPADAPFGPTGVVVTASIFGPPLASDSVTDFVQGPPFTFSAATQPTVNNAVPGRTAVFTHTLTNDGNGTGTFTVIITPPGGWTADPIEPISLDSNESRQVVVRVGVPAGQGGGSYQFDVAAQSTSTPTLVAQTRTDTVVVIGAAVPRLSPPQTKGATLPLPTTVVFTHILTNTGNQAGTFSLAASVVGAPAGWSAVLSQPSCSLVQNASCIFTVHVTVPAGAPVGLTGIIVTASPSGPPPISESVTDFVRVRAPNTPTATPTETPTPTNMPTNTPSATATPTNTPTATTTNTPTATSTPTNAPTSTSMPPTNTPTPPAGPPTCNGQTATIYVNGQGRIVGGKDNGKVYRGKLNGTSANDVIVGTTGNDVIDAKAGNDLLCGLGGNDKLTGDDGNDIIYGGEGTDTLKGSGGTDTLYGEGGDDNLDGDSANDTLNGGSGKDILDGDSGNDTLTGGPYADHFKGGSDTDTATDYAPAEGDTRSSVENV